MANGSAAATQCGGPGRNVPCGKHRLLSGGGFQPQPLGVNESGWFNKLVAANVVMRHVENGRNIPSRVGRWHSAPVLDGYAPEEGFGVLHSWRLGYRAKEQPGLLPQLPGKGRQMEQGDKTFGKPLLL